jgi:small subunit ribosomal protein S16
MIKIRLRRVGAKKQPYYRVVVADARSPRDGRFIENIGNYDPRQDPPEFTIKEDRAIHWLQYGAQPTEAVARLLDKLGTAQKLERVKAGEPLEEVLASVVEVAEEPAAPKKVEAPAPLEEVEEAPAVVEEAAEPVAEMPLEDLGLSARVINALTGAEIDTVQALLSKLAEGREEMLAIPGLGQKSLEEIEEVLRASGLLQ